MNQPFLILTALEDFWPNLGPAVFLGEWCRRPSRRHVWKWFGDTVVGSPLTDQAEIRQAHAYCDVSYEAVLADLSTVLNALNGTSRPVRFWRTFLGPWLWHFIPACYDRYLCLRKARVLHPEAIAIGLSRESFETPRTTAEAVTWLKENELYTLQIYSELLSLMNAPLEARPKLRSPPPASRRFKFTGALRNFLFRTALGAVAKHWRYVAVKDSFFGNRALIRVFLRTGGSVLPLPHWDSSPSRGVSNQEQRSRFRKAWSKDPPPDDVFWGLLREMVVAHLPTSFLEEYPRVSREWPFRPPKAILFATGYWSDDGFKHWTATCREMGTQLLCTSHGGDYGASLFLPGERHELKVSDVYYSWGWTCDTEAGDARVVPMPAPRLVGRRVLGARGDREGILLATTSFPRYLYRLNNWTHHDFHGYLEWAFQFAESLDEETRRALRVRLYPKDYGWDIADRWKARCPSVILETASRSFLDSLDHCRLYVGDHLSTTFAEALSADKPTLLFWDPQREQLRSTAKDAFGSLERVRVLHHSPVAAAAAACQAYADVVSYWTDPARQAAVRAFCQRFARTSADATGAWSRELTSFLRRANR